MLWPSGKLKRSTHAECFPQRYNILTGYSTAGAGGFESDLSGVQGSITPCEKRYLEACKSQLETDYRVTTVTSDGLTILLTNSSTCLLTASQVS